VNGKTDDVTAGMCMTYLAGKGIRNALNKYFHIKDIPITIRKK
jgi:hypothetical protein